ELLIIRYNGKGGCRLSSVVKITEELIQPILEEKDLELVDIEYVKEGKNWFLRILIDKEGGIDISECGLVSEQLSKKLDEHDPIKGIYYLEVFYTGVERTLKTKDVFLTHINKNVFVKLYEQSDGNKEYEGILKAFDNDEAMIEYKEKPRTKQVRIPFEKIAKARLAV